MSTHGLHVLMLGFYPFEEGKVLGGTQAVVSALAPALAANERVDRLTVLSFHRGEVASQTKQINEKFQVRYVRGQRRLNVLTRFFLEVARTRRLISELQPDIVHGHGLGWSGDIATQAWPRAVITVHGMIQQEARMASKGSIRDRIRVRLIDTMARQVLERARVVISISSYSSRMLEGQIRGQHVQIPNPIDPEFFREPSGDAAGKRVVFAGVLRPRKNVEGVLNAFAIARKRHPEARLSIVGPSPDPVYAQQIRDKVQALQVADSVDFIGYVENARLAQEIADSRALLLFSHEETLPTIIAQALAMGKPVISSNVGGVADMVTDGENGFLVAPRDEQAFAERLDTLLSSPVLGSAMGARGREIALNTFTPAAVAHQTVEAYQHALH